MILAGRRLNDSMGAYVASQVMGLMAKRRIHIKGSRILVLGLAFKENCPDLRNSKVIDVIGELRKFGARVEVYDPWVSGREAQWNMGFGQCALCIAIDTMRPCWRWGILRSRASGRPLSDAFADGTTYSTTLSMRFPQRKVTAAFEQAAPNSLKIGTIGDSDQFFEGLSFVHQLSPP